MVHREELDNYCNKFLCVKNFKDYGPNGLLFDLEKDPTETYSYTRENLEVARELHELLEKGRADLKSHVLPNMWNRP